MQRWWVLYVDIFLLLYLYISTSFIGILSFGPGGLSKAFRGVFAPRVVNFFSFNTWTLINILGQNWWETRPSFYSGRTHLAIFCFRILPIPTIYIYIYIYICWIKRVFCLKIVENQVYLWYGYCLNLFGKLRGEANFGNTIAKILWKKVRERREIWCDRRGREKKGISAMVLPNYVPKKSGLTYLKLGTNLTEIKKKKKNCGNWIVNCGKSNASSTNYFIIFLQIVVIANFLLVLIKAHQ